MLALNFVDLPRPGASSRPEGPKGGLGTIFRHFVQLEFSHMPRSFQFCSRYLASVQFREVALVL